MAEAIVHGLPISEKDNLEQALLRGKISAFEDIASLAEDLKEWREVLKGE